MLSFIVLMETVGIIGTFISWARYWSEDDGCSRHSSFRENCEDCKRKIKSNKEKFIFACKATLFFPIWPIALFMFCVNQIRENAKKIEEKKPQICICPECERKFLE